jgi:membrane-associated protease RseP (regulator of RpoE activity)
MLLLLVIILSLIFVHELGHYVVGRLCGVGIKEFSVGFGRKIFSFRAFGNKWSLGMLPLGGYVKFEGEQDYENKKNNPKSFWAVHPLKRLIIALAGPATNLLLPYAIFFFYLWGAPWPDVHPPNGSKVATISAAWAWEGSVDTTHKMYYTIYKATEILKDRGVSHKDIGGPVAIYEITEQARARSVETEDNGFLYQWIAFLSINLGLINLLPIPLLDGGHVVFSIVETAIGRKIKYRTRVWLSYVGIVFVLGIMALAITSDIGRLLA